MTLYKTNYSRSKGVKFKDRSDIQLIDEYTKYKNKYAFHILFNRYRKMVYSVGFNLTKDHYEAEEIVQEVFIILVNKINCYQRRSKFSSWLYKIALNLAKMHIRNNTKFSNCESIYISDNVLDSLLFEYRKQNKYDGFNNPELHAEIVELGSIIKKITSKLPEGYRDVFNLGVEKGYTFNEISKTLGISLSAVKSRMLRSRRYLQERLINYI